MKFIIFVSPLGWEVVVNQVRVIKGDFTLQTHYLKIFQLYFINIKNV